MGLLGSWFLMVRLWPALVRRFLSDCPFVAMADKRSSIVLMDPCRSQRSPGRLPWNIWPQFPLTSSVDFQAYLRVKTTASLSCNILRRRKKKGDNVCESLTAQPVNASPFWQQRGSWNTTCDCRHLAPACPICMDYVRIKKHAPTPSAWQFGMALHGGGRHTLLYGKLFEHLFRNIQLSVLTIRMTLKSGAIWKSEV